jgi:hypothetical protein
MLLSFGEGLTWLEFLAGFHYYLNEIDPLYPSNWTVSPADWLPFFRLPQGLPFYQCRSLNKLLLQLRNLWVLLPGRDHNLGVLRKLFNLHYKHNRTNNEILRMSKIKLVQSSSEYKCVSSSHIYSFKWSLISE